MDTGVLVGATLTRDQHHEAARPIVRAADSEDIAPLLITDFILSETLNFLVQKASSLIARDALTRLESSPGFIFERVPDTSYDRGRDQVFRRYDGLSFVDCLTVAWMEDHDVETIYTFDDDFDKVEDIVRRTTVGN